MEIEFRGRNKNTGEWHYGSLVVQTNGLSYIVYDFDHIELVESESVGQYTGIKDRNGNKIYKDDIIENKVYGGIAKIVWGLPNQHYCGWTIEWIRDSQMSSKTALLYYKNLENCEVIGNIYDNPELLE